MFNGVLELSISGLIIITLILTHVTIASVTIFLHRHQAHRALTLHPAVSHFFRFWLWLTTGMITRQWVAVHRKHHACCETEEDPHSPQVLGIQKVFWEGAELYRIAAHNQEIIDKYSYGTPDDWIERNLYTPYNFYGVGLMLIINIILFGAIGLTVWAVQMIWIPIFAAGVINGVGHWWGYRNYECNDAATNIVPWGILIGGEELHNNHHTYASSARLSSKWWEFDIGWFYICLLSAVRLAQVKKVAPRLYVTHHKSYIDMDTLKAVVNNRFQVMSCYAHEVMAKVHREELRQAQGAYRHLLSRARCLLVREESLLKPQDQDHLRAILQSSDTLQTVYQYRQRLQALWQQTAVNQDVMVKALQDWCRQAEETGIKSLAEFAGTLRSYTLQPA